VRCRGIESAPSLCCAVGKSSRHSHSFLHWILNSEIQSCLTPRWERAWKFRWKSLLTRMLAARRLSPLKSHQPDFRIFGGGSGKLLLQLEYDSCEVIYPGAQFISLRSVRPRNLESFRPGASGILQGRQEAQQTCNCINISAKEHEPLGTIAIGIRKDVHGTVENTVRIITRLQTSMLGEA
jgi:hypothetical protein